MRADRRARSLGPIIGFDVEFHGSHGELPGSSLACSIFVHKGRHCPNGHTARRFARLGMVKRKVARRGFEMKWMAVVIAGRALLAQGGHATAKESALTPRACAAQAQEAGTSEEPNDAHTQLMRPSYAIFLTNKKK